MLDLGQHRRGNLGDFVALDAGLFERMRHVELRDKLLYAIGAFERSGARLARVEFHAEPLRDRAETLRREIKKRLLKMHKLQHSLRRQRTRKRGGKRPTVDTVTRKVNGILTGRHMQQLLRVEVVADPDGSPTISYY